MALFSIINIRHVNNQFPLLTHLTPYLLYLQAIIIYIFIYIYLHIHTLKKMRESGEGYLVWEI